MASECLGFTRAPEICFSVSKRFEEGQERMASETATQRSTALMFGKAVAAAGVLSSRVCT